MERSSMQWCELHLGVLKLQGFMGEGQSICVHKEEREKELGNVLKYHFIELSVFVKKAT